MLPEFAGLGVPLELLLLPRHPHLLAEPGRHLLQPARHTRQTLQSRTLYTGDCATTRTAGHASNGGHTKSLVTSHC